MNPQYIFLNIYDICQQSKGNTGQLHSLLLTPKCKMYNKKNHILLLENNLILYSANTKKAH